MKKAYKIVIGIFLLIFIALVSVPYLFQDKIVALIKKTANESVHANIDFSDASLSLLRNFPKASMQLSNVAVTNLEPFKGDTLFYAKNINLKLKLTNLLKVKDGALHISSFIIDEALVNVLVNEEGKANYDIAKETETTETETTTESSSFELSVNEYAIKNSAIKYIDKQGKMEVLLSDFSHSGSGDFSQENVALATQTNTDVSFTMEGSNYIDHQHLDLDATLALDLANSKYSFLENEAHINQLPLIFDGFVQLHENTQEINLNFKTPSSDFKNFLALIPKEYAKDIADVKTTGDFSVIGKVNGMVSDTTIPKLDISMESNNASFKYPDLPKSVENIHLKAHVKNTTGYIKNTFVNVDKLAFKIDDNKFSGKAKIANLTTNPAVNATMNGTIDLGAITKVYPIEMAKELSGIITANLNTDFDMDAVTNHVTERIKKNGTVEVKDFIFDGKDIANPLEINHATVDFKTQRISLTDFNAKTGSTDLSATGTIDNLIEFMLADGDLKGDFTLHSNLFRMSDFMTTETVEESSEEVPEETTEETLKIPAFLNCTVSAIAKEVHYDNLQLKNVKGTLVLKDQKAILKDVKGDMFGGSVALNGAVNTKEKNPVFDMNLGIDSFDIGETFTNIDMFKMLSPIATIFKGDLNTNLNLSGDLKDDFTPNLKSLSGKALAEILASNINPEKSQALSLLNDKLSFVNLNELNINDIKTNVAFENGTVSVKPFTVKYKDIDIAVAGTHSIDQIMDYTATFDVPAKYLGQEVTGLLSKLDASNGDMLVPITANLTGNFTSPTIKTDLKSAVSNLTTQLVKQQKDKLVNKAIGGLLGGTKSDSTTTTKKTIGNAIGGLLNSKKDTTNTKTNVKDKAVEKVGDVLGGLFGKKKKN